MKVIEALVAFPMLAALFPAAANAQLTLFTFDGTTETPVGATYNYPTISAGSTESVRFRVFNTTTSPVTISTLSVGGAGFSFAAINGTLPYPIPPAPSTLNFLEFTVQFTGTIVASYSANLQVNGISALLLAVVVAVPPPTIAPVPMFVSGCTQPTPGGVVFSATEPIGTSGTCNFTLQNTGTQPLAISVTVTGNGFQGPQGTQTLNPGATTSFAITFTPQCGTTSPNYSGLLTITATATGQQPNGQTFALSAVGTTPTPAPTINVASVSASAQQPTLTLSLPNASPCGASGYLNLVFTSNVPGVAGDSSVVFLQGNVTSLPFMVAANSTAITIEGQPSTTFQTGTTAGTITFTTTAAPTGSPLAGVPTATATITIPPALITIDSATASNQISGQLNVEVTGFDNTYSAGAMSFTFFDTTGKQVGSPIDVNFTSQFKSYFAGQSSGSAFLMNVSFPVLGNQALIGTVQMTLTNSAGPVQTGPLTFQ
jgi:hypothetical protein